MVQNLEKIIEEVKEFFQKPFNANNVKPEKGVSKNSAKRVNSYMDKYERIINKDTEAQIEGRALTNEEIAERYKTLDEMKNQVTGRLDDKKNKSAENIDKLTTSGILSVKDGESAKAIGSETAKVRTNMYTNKVQEFKEKRI